MPAGFDVARQPSFHQRRTKDAMGRRSPKKLKWMALFLHNVLGNDEYLKSKNGSAFTIEAHN